ncbi:hypothetical protein Avbf_12092 [Armadillidium vulgare]|nr:hypothetical protein Avbf_12092 [Armadillidium vulgare]
MMLDDGVDTEDSPAVAISLAAMPKLEFQRRIRIPTSFHLKRTPYNRKEPKESSLKQKFRKLGLYSKQILKVELKNLLKVSH